MVIHITVDEQKVSSLADDLSVLVVNRVLAKDINIHEALKALTDAVTYSIGRTMSAELFNKLFDESNHLALTLIRQLKNDIDSASDDNDPVNITHVMLAMNTVLSYVLANVEE